MLHIATQISSLIASVSIVFAIFAYRREVRGQNLTGLFYLHQYLSQESFAEARRVSFTRLAHTPYAEWTDEDKEAAYRLCLSFEEAALLLGGEVLNDAGRKLMMESYWGKSVCVHFEILEEFLAAKFTPTMTAAEYFPNFVTLHEIARTIHGPGAVSPAAFRVA